MAAVFAVVPNRRQPKIPLWMGSLSFHTVKRSLALDVNYCNMGCAGVAENNNHTK